MKMADEDIKAAFELLRPLCVVLTKQHSQRNLSALITALEGIKPEVLQELQEYVLFPLRIIFKQSASKCVELYTDALKCLHLVLSHTDITRWETFQDLFNQLCLMISSPANNGQVLGLSEELKLEVVRCLRALLNRASFSVMESVYTPVFLPPLGHAVSLCLNMAEHEQLRQLRIESMLCVLDLTQSHRKVGHKFLVQIGDLFASFLPGISMSLCKIITGDTKQGQAVTKTAIEVWTKVVSMVMGDEYILKESSPDSTGKDTSPSNDKYLSLQVKRNQEWVTGTAAKLKILVKNIVSVSSHPNWKVRLCLVEWSRSILLKCSKSMKDSISLALDVLVSLVGDEYSIVATQSQGALQEFKASHQSDDSRVLTELLEENLHSLATSLPRLMRTADEDKKIATLNLFVGYLKLMGPEVNRLLLSASHLQRVSLALLQVTELDCSQIRIIQEKATGSHLPGAGEMQTPVRPKKHFKHFVDDRIHLLLITVCRTLGFYGDLDLLVDHFLDLWSQSTLNRKQATLCINEIMLGKSGEGVQQISEGEDCIPRNPSDLEHIVRMVVEEYISPTSWNLVTSNQPEVNNISEKTPDWHIVNSTREALNLEMLGSNILQICLSLEGLGHFAKILKEHYRDLLMDVLYPILEKLGDDSAIVSHTAYLTLLDITTACKYRDVEDLLCSNADYLVNSVSLRMRHLSRNPRAPVVLQVMLSHSGVDILPLIDDTIHEVLEALDQYYDERAVQFMGILRSLVQAIQKWYPSSAPIPELKKTSTLGVENVISPQENTNEDYKEPLASCSVRDFFLEYHKQKQIAEGNVDDLDLDEDPAVTEGSGKEEDTDPDVKKEPPKHIGYVMKVLEKCIHIMPSPDPRLRLLVLRTVAEASEVMGQDRENYLPLVHKLWPPFVARFQDEEHLVILQAFQSLIVMATSSGDFLRQRVMKDIVPKLENFLKKQSTVSVNCGPAYKFTTSFKLQVAILQGIGLLCHKVDLGESQLARLIRASLPYLSKRQASQLQQEAVGAFKQFIDLDADCVWLYLVDIYCPVTFKPSHPTMKQIKVSGSSNRNEYTDNIQLLVDRL